MFVRASTIVGDPALMEAGINDYKNNMVPAARQLGGFLGAMLLLDRQSGKGLGLTFWESQEALRASEDAANKLRADGASTLKAKTAPTVERFEVVYYGVPQPSVAK